MLILFIISTVKTMHINFEFRKKTDINNILNTCSDIVKT